ncbi:velvet factor-domain-containing protein [Mycena metata]|uniref:Velvet factor-domain-containing protein n=1 Tax=Mycena metata TaxID=1033252 RepID=A0AAD7JA37_9AGAR|nr:velvet factor-domain-containing protein [Mycena metata]
MSFSSLQYNLSSMPLILQDGDDQFHQSTLRLEKNFIDTPILFTEGQFAGRSIRATLEEIQAAGSSRKTVTVRRGVKVDRRPLDPAPVAYLRLFEVFNVGTAGEIQLELDYHGLDISGFTCTVDLFSVPKPESTSSAAFEWPEPEPLTHFPLGPNSTPQQIEVDPDVSCGNVTTKLAGNTFVQADNPLSLSLLVSTHLHIQDLAVKAEGYFMLQYRFFDLFSTTSEHANPTIQAQCQGAPFRVYSAKDAPALGPSTELSKHLACYGVRLNIRKTVRKRTAHHDGSPSRGLLYTTHRLSDKNIANGDEEGYDD